MSNTTVRHYIDVITVLAQKDFKIRYRNSVLGFLWSLLNPLAYMTVITLVFGVLLRVNIPNFAAWALTGLLLWRYFSVASSQSLMSVIGNPSLVTKVYISRYLLVLSNNVANFIGAILEFTTLFPVLILLGVQLTVYVLVLPLILITEFFLIFGLSLSLASLNLKYRDFFQLWEIALQLGFFLTPLVYDVSLVPTRFQFAYSLNPVTRLIVSARDILLQHQMPTLFDGTVIISGTAILLLIGFAVFHRFESHFAEEI